MDITGIKQAKECMRSVQDAMDFMQDKGYVPMDSKHKLSELYRWDLTDFIMYMIAADRQINIDEVEIYRYLTGYGGDSLDSIKKNIEEGDVLSGDFQSRIPLSLQYLVRANNSLIIFNDSAGNGMSSALHMYVLSFALAGKEVMQADDSTSYAERRNFELYINNLKIYINDKSYAPWDRSLDRLLLC